jgi:hypothetical protein
MRADGQRSGRQHTKDGRYWSGGNGKPHARWPYRRGMILPRNRRRALDQIGHRLSAEDPGLVMRFAFFTMLTRHGAMPATEQVPRRRQLFLRRAALLPLIAISLAAVLTASWLTPSRQACPAGPSPVARNLSSLSPAARCQRGPAIRLDTIPVH